jgi:hypothetical protein
MIVERDGVQLHLHPALAMDLHVPTLTVLPGNAFKGGPRLSGRTRY